MGAMQAQEYKMMRWAVAMRTSAPSAEAFRLAYDRGEIIRTHLQRATWQLISKEDYWWMLRLCGAKSEAALKGWMHTNGIFIENDELLKIRELLIRTAGEYGSVTKEDFVRALAENGIRMDAHRLSYHIRLAEMSGTLCSGKLLPQKASYSLVSDKIGPEHSGPERDEALSMLARKYFQSHSPATLEDFVWWSGLNTGDCRRALTILGSEIETVTFGERKFHIHNSCRTRGFRKGTVHLLPPYDEYLIGYKSRDISLDPEFSHKAHSGNGIFYPVVLSDGIVCGNWRASGSEVKFEFFGDTAPSTERALEIWSRFAGGKV